MTNELREKLFDEMLKSALDEHTENPALESEAELRQKGISVHVFSASFERKMDRLIHKERHEEWKRLHEKAFRRIAACVALVLLASGTAIISVDALRVPIFNFFMSIEEKYSIIQVENTNKVINISENLREYLPTYVPDGYTETSVIEDTNSFMIEYKNHNGDYFVLDFWKSAQGGAVDTEDSVISELEVQKYRAIFIQKEARIIVIWMPGGHEYHITGNISKKEAILILESVKNIF